MSGFRFAWLAVSLFAAACHAEKPLPAVSDFFGTWKIVSIAGYGDMGGGQPVGKELLGAKLTVTPQGMALNVDKWSCVADGGYRVQEVDMSYLLDDSGARPEEVQLPARVVRLAGDNNCLHIFWLDPNLIEFDYIGVFVHAKREA